MSDSSVKLIDALADGQFHSGEELGALLGISRTAVWKQVQKLVELGLEVDKIKGRGYCVPGGIELFSGERIRSDLLPAAEPLLARLDILTTTDSTNSVVRQLAEEADASGCVVLAEQQTAGRGRRGRQWVSPFARNLYLSVAWGFEGGAAALEGLSLAVGVAVKRAVASLGISGAQLKWPNDILFNGKKVAGILLEMIGDPAGFCQVVVGIGINIDMPESKGADIDQSWTDLRRVSGQSVSRNQVVVALLNELLPMLASYQKKGFCHYREEWQGSDAFRGQPVELVMAKNSISGIANGVSETGAIGLLVEGEQRYFNGGEISLRGAQ
ncbi:bifunctional biotin--[acetyl-CoA-carboxylase] ligase/biotin operon repressor BirA [Porticoccus sp. W117]|uniref:bifunctional biotin--[acetyl-CoA-carboxylase] ligase/biotin operon repressor BirA n=1 Tax=Porticoccus sp. W117 TaxID=3054777 RepID=UPI00259ADD9B|nr:bifunctional biotin--[acetyl-CoA-carboxylase] ligase/biotin operon repressor BirA [Porticoccus sp. W117]MDM3870581.1 bifunctional biotin--[acetyl-CoA-carboxylase] ligase/biotin operon repressor BirA [Porticoccus sp. W117]